MTSFDDVWADAVGRVCDPVMARADVGFVRQVMTGDGGHVHALLWEAEPLRFAERYPDSRIVESYGDQWPPPCIDYWVYVDPRLSRAELSFEGWSEDPDDVGLTGHGALDGVTLGTVFARVLGVPPPSG